MLAKRTYKNQITIPKSVMDAFPNVEYFDVARRNQTIVLCPVDVRPAGSQLEKIRAKVRALGLTDKDLEAAIRSARRNAR
jgi:hypothetical protein